MNLAQVLSLPNLLKYALEGLAVSAVALYLSGRNRNLQRVAVVGVTAALAFLVLDLFAPGVASGARQGSGWTVGTGLVGGQQGGASDWSHSWYSQTAAGGPAAISRATLEQIHNAPVFNPLSETAAFPTPGTGIIPNGLYLAHEPSQTPAPKAANDDDDEA